MPISTAPNGRAWAEIDLTAIRANVAAIRRLIPSGAQIMAVVKADAYGHGLLPTAQAATAAGAEWLGVAAVSEGVALREVGLHSPIALLCAPAPEEAETLVRHDLTACVGDEATLAAIASATRAHPARNAFAIHLDIDTGMGRSGVLPENAVTLWRQAQQAGLRVTGLTTHFADAEHADSETTLAQQNAFVRARTLLAEAGAHFDLIHTSNSAAILTACGDAGANLARPGLLLYGIAPECPTPPHPNPSPWISSLRSAGERLSFGFLPSPAREAGRQGEGLGVRAALTLKARVAAVRDLPAGHTISYGATYRLERPSRVATILIGYGDGYPRRLSNQGAALLRGQRAPILGRVCMDQTVVDVTGIPGVVPGEEAVCIGRQGAERITVEEIARAIEATEHEITTGLTARLPRQYL